ncbi:MAG: hypothetical protein GX227_05085, partial [Clostridiaceae bacterium]|nr:hypothetical protein [Clostridiaceae bacterium]
MKKTTRVCALICAFLIFFTGCARLDRINDFIDEESLYNENDKDDDPS